MLQRGPGPEYRVGEAFNELPINFQDYVSGTQSSFLRRRFLDRSHDHDIPFLLLYFNANPL